MVFLKISQKFTGKDLRRSLFFDKVAGTEHLPPTASTSQDYLPLFSMLNCVRLKTFANKVD